MKFSDNERYPLAVADQRSVLIYLRLDEKRPAIDCRITVRSRVRGTRGRKTEISCFSVMVNFATVRARWRGRSVLRRLKAGHQRQVIGGANQPRVYTFRFIAPTGVFRRLGFDGVLRHFKWRDSGQSANAGSIRRANRGVACVLRI